MIICPNCQHFEIPGALFCSECGSQLVSKDPFDTQLIQKSPSDYFDSTISFDPYSVGLKPDDMAEPCLTLRVVDSNEIIHLTGRKEFTIGRVAEGQPILPDIDLSAYQAYTLGVSRLHASVKISPQRAVVMDLGSSNGTRVNGQKIVPNVDYLINLGDIVALGKLKIQIISYQSPKE
jgi:hypothetical protein